VGDAEPDVDPDDEPEVEGEHVGNGEGIGRAAADFADAVFEDDFFEGAALVDFLDVEALFFALAFDDLEDPAVRVAGTRSEMVAHNN